MLFPLSNIKCKMNLCFRFPLFLFLFSLLLLLLLHFISDILLKMKRTRTNMSVYGWERKATTIAIEYKTTRTKGILLAHTYATHPSPPPPTPPICLCDVCYAPALKDEKWNLLNTIESAVILTYNAWLSLLPNGYDDDQMNGIYMWDNFYRLWQWADDGTHSLNSFFCSLFVWDFPFPSPASPQPI